MLIPLGILASSGGGAAGSFDLISTTVLSSSQSSVTFDVTGLGSTYKHLQLRMAHQHNTSAGLVAIRLNSDSGSNYSRHYLDGNGSSVVSGSEASMTYLQVGYSPASYFNAAVFDLLDAFSTTKYKTSRTLFGSVANPAVSLASSNWGSTSAVTSVTVFVREGYSFVSGSRFSLYGIKG